MAPRKTPLAKLLDRSLSSFQDYPAWLADRRGRVTATEAKKLYEGGDKAITELRDEKIAGKSLDLSGNKYVARGNEREPIIAAWIENKFGLTPNDVLFYGSKNERHAATPDAIGLIDKKLTGAEIKTSKNDLSPGPIVDGILQSAEVTPQMRKSMYFYQQGYDLQMQWQMHIMDADRMLFVGEQHDNDWENGPHPLELEPIWCWVLRDQDVIDVMVERADILLAQLDEYNQAEQDALAKTFEMDVEYLADLQAEAADLEQRIDNVKASIRDRIGRDKETFSLTSSAGWKVTLSANNGRSTFRKEDFEAAYPGVYSKFVTPGVKGEPKLTVTLPKTTAAPTEGASE